MDEQTGWTFILRSMVRVTCVKNKLLVYEQMLNILFVCPKRNTHE